MLHDVGHEKTFGKPEPYQHVEQRTEQSGKRFEQVGNRSGPEPERCQDRHLVPHARSHDHGRSEGQLPASAADIPSRVDPAATLARTRCQPKLRPPAMRLNMVVGLLGWAAPGRSGGNTENSPSGY